MKKLWYIWVALAISLFVSLTPVVKEISTGASVVSVLLTFAFEFGCSFLGWFLLLWIINLIATRKSRKAAREAKKAATDSTNQAG